MYNKPKKYTAKVTKKVGFRPSFGDVANAGVGKFGEETVVQAKFGTKKSPGKKQKKFFKAK